VERYPPQGRGADRCAAVVMQAEACVLGRCLNHRRVASASHMCELDWAANCTPQAQNQWYSCAAKQTMAFRVVYLQRSQSIEGRNALMGRRLFDKFREISDHCLLAHTVVSNELAAHANPAFPDDLLSRDAFLAFDPHLLYIEGGLFATTSEWRVERSTLDEYLRRGGSVIVADVDLMNADRHRTYYHEAVEVLGARIDYDSDGAAIDLIDQYGKHEMVCRPSEMLLSDWIEPIYAGVTAIIAGSPVRLMSIQDILATGNRNTVRAMAKDRLTEYRPDLGVFASIAQVINGYVAFIAAGVSHDAWTKRCPDNTLWLSNIATALVAESNRQRARATPYLNSPHELFLSHRSIDHVYVAQVSQQIRRLGISTWLDRDQILPGDSFVEEINRGLDHMTHFVLFWSAGCVGAPWVTRELNVAVTKLTERRIPLVLVRMDDTAVPSIIADLHRIEASGMSAFQVGSALVEAIHRRAQRIRE